MNIDEFIKRVDEAIAIYDFEMSNIADMVALAALALVRVNIQNSGEIGRKYSNNKLPLFFFNDRALNGGGRAALERAKKDGEGLSYEEWRQANGLQTAFVDLTFSGRMLQNLQITERTKTDQFYKTIINASEKENLDKISWNHERFGDFLIVTAEQKLELDKLLDTLLQDFFDKHFKF